MSLAQETMTSSSGDVSVSDLFGEAVSRGEEVETKH